MTIEEIEDAIRAGNIHSFLVSKSDLFGNFYVHVSMGNLNVAFGRGNSVQEAINKAFSGREGGAEFFKIGQPIAQRKPDIPPPVVVDEDDDLLGDLLG